MRSGDDKTAAELGPNERGGLIEDGVRVYGAGVVKRVCVETSVVSYYCARRRKSTPNAM